MMADGGGRPTWELFARPGGVPGDGILFAGTAALLVNPSSREEALFAFVAALAPSEGESLDLLRHGGVGAVAAAGVAGVGADADPRVGAVAAAGVAGAGADADPRVGAVAAAGVAGVAPSSLISFAFQRISSFVRLRLAARSRLP